ncbi:hypothetical protein [Clostridium senegalense]
MKVRCINNNGMPFGLTLNKEYELLDSKHGYKIKDDFNIIRTCPKSWFSIVKEKESDNMEKTFKEVIQDKVVGHVWKQISKSSMVDRIEIKEYGPRIYLRENRKSIGFRDTIFKLIKQPVTFEEVLNSEKRCKVEHELLHEQFEYQPLDNLMYYLSYSYYENDFKQILKEGKWYLED